MKEEFQIEMKCSKCGKKAEWNSLQLCSKCMREWYDKAKKEEKESL